MEADRNLLFGVLALQADLLTAEQFIQACTLWSTRKHVALAEVLIELGWITAADRADVDRLLARKLKKHGDARAGLAAVPEALVRSLAALAPEIGRSLAGLAPSAEPAETVTVDHVPQPHPRYALTRLHATGGIGQVWLAHDRELDRDIALKELRPEMARQTAVQARFLQEARITGQLEHPGIVPVYELAHQPGTRQPFYTMRFVNGQTLSQAAQAYHQKRRADSAEPLDFLALLGALVTVCNTIAYAHSRGVLHRDLKGQNVVVGAFGEVVVLDWGLAKRLHRADEDTDLLPVVPAPEPTEMDLTVQGQALGTPAYMAPEQAAGRLEQIDHRTDVYGLGAILYEILTGQPPFTGADTHEVLRKVREEEPLPPHRLHPEVPAMLEAICLRALAKEPAERCASAAELAQELQQWQEVQCRQAQEDLDRFFALSIDLMCTAGFDGYFKQLNPAWEHTLGYTREELLAQPFSNFIHPEDRAVTAREMERLSSGGDTVSLENRYRCKDGAYRWLYWTATPYFGDRRVIYAAARDITERKQVEAALRQSEERYRLVIAAMPSGVVLLGADGTIQACNPSAARILGLSADQMMGRTPHDPRWRAIHEDGSPFLGETHPPMISLRTGQPCSDVIMGIHKPAGELTWIAVNTQPLFRGEESSPYAVVASFEDITRRKQIEDALQRALAELACCRQRLASSRQESERDLFRSSPETP